MLTGVSPVTLESASGLRPQALGIAEDNSERPSDESALMQAYRHSSNHFCNDRLNHDLRVPPNLV